MALMSSELRRSLGALGIHDYQRSVKGLSGGEAKRIASGVRSSASPTSSSSMSRRTTLTSRASSGSRATSPAPRWVSYSSPTTATSSTASATRSSSSWWASLPL